MTRTGAAGGASHDARAHGRSSGRGGPAASTSSTTSVGTRKTLAGIDALTAVPLYGPHDARLPALQNAAEATLQEGLARYELSTGRQRFAGAGDQPRARSSRSSQPRRTPVRAGVAAGARGVAAAALRRALAGRDRAPERTRDRKSGRDGRASASPTDGCCRSSTWSDRGGARPQDLRRRARAGRRGNGQRCGPRRVAHPAERPGRRAGAREPHRADPRDGGRLLLSAEPAQPRHAGPPPARLRPQAADLSRRARARAAAEHPRAGTRPSPCRRSADDGYARRGDYWTPKNYDGGSAGHHHPAPGARELEEPRHRAPPRRRHRGPIPSRASNASASSPSRRSSTSNACGTIPSSSARSRCGSSTSPPSTRPSRTKAPARRPTPSRAIEEGGRDVYRRKPDAAGPARLGRPRRLLPAEDDAAGRARTRHRRARCAASRPMSPARPARPTTRTTPGSSASQTTSPSRYGSATTMPTASGAPSGAARPAPRSRCRSSEPILEAAWAASRRRRAPLVAALAGGRAPAHRAADRSDAPATGSPTDAARLSRNISGSTARAGSSETQYRLVPEDRGLRVPPARSLERRSMRAAITGGRTAYYAPAPQLVRDAARAGAPRRNPGGSGTTSRLRRRPRRVDPDYRWNNGPIY